MQQLTPPYRQQPRNRGRNTGQKASFKRQEVWAIRFRLQLASRKRDLTLFNLAIDSKLRGCDLVSLRVRDICNGDEVLTRARVIQQKTGKPVQFEVTVQTRATVGAWIAKTQLSQEDYLFRKSKNLRAVQLLLGHTKLESKIRYLGVEVEDALMPSEQTEV